MSQPLLSLKLQQKISLFSFVLLLACTPQASGPAGIADSRLLLTDGAGISDAGSNNRDARLLSDTVHFDVESVDNLQQSFDASIPEAGAWSEDAGVAYHPDCLNTESKTLAVCFADAQNRAALAGPRQLRWTRAVATVDRQGLIQDAHPGISYTFCYPEAGAFDCLVVDYWWSIGTPQVSLTRLHRVGVGEPRSLLLSEVVDSPEVMVAYSALPECEVLDGDFVQLSRYAEAGLDRAQLVNGSDSAVLRDDDSLLVLDNHCGP